MDPGLRLTPEMGATTDEQKEFMLTIPYLAFLPILDLPIGMQSNISSAICKVPKT